MASIRKMMEHGSEGEFRSDESITYSESNVFSLMDIDEEQNINTTTIASYAEDVAIGFGTQTPSCRLSFGKNTDQVFTNENVKDSIPAICLNEEANGTDATGISFYERYDPISKQRAEAGLAFMTSNENYRTTYNGEIFTNTIDPSGVDIPMSILSRTNGHSQILINHNPVNTTLRATFGNQRVSLDVSGAVRMSDFLILGKSNEIVGNSTDFNALNTGTVIFDGTRLYLKQEGTGAPTEILLKTDAESGQAADFDPYNANGPSAIGIYQSLPILVGSTLTNDSNNLFKNELIVVGNSIIGTTNDEVNKQQSFRGDSLKKGILNVETGIGINGEWVDARFHINSSTEPYFIAGVDNGLNNANKVDLSDNTFIVGDSNHNLQPKSTCFGDNNSNIGAQSFNVGYNNQSTGSNCFVQGSYNEVDNAKKTVIFGEYNIIRDTEYISSPGKNVHNFIAGFNNKLYDGSSNFIFGTNIDTSGVSHTAAFGCNADVSQNLRFVIGTEELNGNAFTMDISGNIQTEGDIKCLSNKDKTIYDNCDFNITIGNAKTLTLFPGEIANYSDKRLKFNIEDIPEPLKTICKLKGVRYNRNDIKNDSKKHIGLIAQEVEKVVPEVVNNAGGDNNYLSVSYGNLVSLLIESVKEMNTKMVSLEDENKSLKGDVTLLKEQMQEILKKI
jgi:hypothetical protein